LDGDREKLWAHPVREVIVPEGKTGANADILNDVPDRHANGKEDEDAAGPIEHDTVNQGKGDWGKNMQRDDCEHGNLAGKDL